MWQIQNGEHSLKPLPAPIHPAKLVSILIGRSESFRENDALEPNTMTPLFRAYGYGHKGSKYDQSSSSPVIFQVQLSDSVIEFWEFSWAKMKCWSTELVRTLNNDMDCQKFAGNIGTRIAGYSSPRTIARLTPTKIPRTANAFRRTMGIPAISKNASKWIRLGTSEHLTFHIYMEIRTHGFEEDLLKIRTTGRNPQLTVTAELATCGL